MVPCCSVTCLTGDTKLQSCKAPSLLKSLKAWKEYNGQVCVLPYWEDPGMAMDAMMNDQNNQNGYNTGFNTGTNTDTGTTDIANLRTHLQYSDQNVLDRSYCGDFVREVHTDEQEQI